MKKKIFKYNLLVGILVMVLCVVLFFSVLFQYYENQAFMQLGAELHYIAHGIELSGETYLNTLETTDRVTWIDAEGTVRYDSESDPAEMQNHIDREEIVEAIETGEGQSSRWSDTLLKYSLYSAVLLDDGTVIRVSRTQSSAIALLLTLVWPVLGILLAAVAVCTGLSYRLAKAIVDPINQVDLTHPVVDATYSELHPLVERIREQNHTISSQINELKQKQREFSALTENMCEGFMLLDDNMNILSFNAAALHVISGNHDLNNLRRDCTFPPVISAAEESLAGERAETIQEIEDRSWQIIANPITVHGRTAGAAVLLMDVTEREQRERLRQEFTANVSHELKTPLTSISGFAELMSEGLVSPEKTAEFARDIYRESQRLISLVDDIIRLSRLEEDNKYEWETVNLLAVCNEVKEILTPAAAQKNVSFSLTGDPVFLAGSKQILQDMVFNLCDNSIKYNQDGGTVIVTLGESGNHAYLNVSDNGIGIPYADQGRVFERFYRVDKSHSKSIGGTGLGLSIVKHAVQYHNASISLSSIPGHGTSITIVF